MNARIIAITNQKGGVGKTTTAVSLAASLSAMKKKVLLIDLDPQGNATIGSGIHGTELDFTVADLLLGLISIDNVIKDPGFGYDLLPANAQLITAELKLSQLEGREYQLRIALQTKVGSYDFILIDCPPALGILTVNALVAAHSVLIPVQCEYYALEGLAALLLTLEQLKVVNPQLEIEGLLRTMYDGRNRLTQEVSEQLSTHFAAKLYRTVIPRNVRLAEAPSHGMPALNYCSQSHGAMAYLALAGEVIQQHTVKSS